MLRPAAGFLCRRQLIQKKASETLVTRTDTFRLFRRLTSENWASGIRLTSVIIDDKGLAIK